MPTLDRTADTTTTGAVGDDATNRLRLAVLRTARGIRTNTIGDVTPSQLAVLSTLARHGESSVGQIAEHEHVQPPSVSRIVAHLEERGLVERHPDPIDRRRVVIGLSPTGESYLAEVRAAANTWLGSRLDRLGDADRAALTAALPALERLLVPDDERPDDEPVGPSPGARADAAREPSSVGSAS